jgi:hypothetical protein
MLASVIKLQDASVNKNLLKKLQSKKNSMYLGVTLVKTVERF